MFTLKISRMLILAGTFFLILAGVLHLYFGYPSISNDLAALGAPVMVANIIKAVWVMFSSHLLLIAALLLVALIKRATLPAFVIVICGLIPILDGAILTYSAGPWNLGWMLPGILLILSSFSASSSLKTT